MDEQTEFSEFAQALAVYRQKELSPEKFTRELFGNIHIGTINKTSPIIEDMEDRTLRGYFYSQNNITYLAKKISDDLDIGAFAEYITVDADDSAHSLVIAFRKWCPRITDDTYGMEIAERFQTIIQTAASTKRKKATTKASIPVAKIEDYKSKFGISLVAEVRSICPNDGCTNPLFVRAAGKIDTHYDVVVIDTKKAVKGENNLIAMCPDCAKKYDLGRNDDSVKRMRAIKDRFLELASIQETVSEQKLEEDVCRVLQKVSSLPCPTDVDLNYVPVTISQKVPNNPELMARIKVWVNLHYPDVHATLQDLNRENKLRFEPFCMQVRLVYLNLKSKGYSQNDIFEGMIKWLMDATNEGYHPCEVVISYFVQKCEVFDVTS